ncbi:MAG: DinB family protein [Kineosporiaceae bacterium]
MGTSATPAAATTTSTRSGPDARLDQERNDLLETLRKHRFFLRYTARGLTDEQAGLRPTVSQLSVGGIIKHVAQVESNWVDFVLGGAEAMMHGKGDWSGEDWAAGHTMLHGETLEGVLARYDEVAARTDELVATLPSLDVSHPLPSAPWFEPGARWSARRAILHILAETAQHAGHADIIRESLDGAKTMG